jgi:hypothetical protein
MAYVGSTNNVVTNGAGSYLFALKTALIAAGWTVVSSGTGTAGVTGAGDLLPTAASFGVAGAWARVREAGASTFYRTAPQTVSTRSSSTAARRDSTQAGRRRSPRRRAAVTGGL